MTRFLAVCGFVLLAGAFGAASAAPIPDEQVRRWCAAEAYNLTSDYLVLRATMSPEELIAALTGHPKLVAAFTDFIRAHVAGDEAGMRAALERFIEECVAANTSGVRA